METAYLIPAVELCAVSVLGVKACYAALHEKYNKRESDNKPMHYEKLLSGETAITTFSRISELEHRKKLSILNAKIVEIDNGQDYAIRAVVNKNGRAVIVQVSDDDFMSDSLTLAELLE